MPSQKRRSARRAVAPAAPAHTSPARWLRPAVAALAAAGVALSAWLTYLQYSSASVPFCLTGSGCDVVRDSRYAYVFGIPMSLVGIAGYSLVLLAALVPLASHQRRLALYALTLAGLTYSLYLTYLEFFVIKALCSYCLVSLGLMAALLVTVLLAWPPRLSRPLVAGSGAIVAVVLLGALLAPKGQAAPPSAEENFRVGLAQHLTASGAVMYGAYWCHYCAQQKEWFGPAFQYIKYVECDPQGQNANPRLCQQKGIRGYPTWEIGGQMYEGAIPLDKLAELVGYGP